MMKIPMVHFSKNKILIASVVLFLSYVFGPLFHNVIHELGHAIAVLVQGGTVTGFFFHPIKSSFNSSTYVPNHLLLYAGGAFIGLPITIISLILAFRYKSPVFFPFAIACAYGFLNTGKWMVRSAISPEIVTDYTCMVDLGVPGFLMVGAGFIYIFFGALARIFFLPLAGIDYNASIRDRIIFYLAGILPWYLIVGLYNALALNSPATTAVRLIVLYALYLVAEAVVSKLLQKKFRTFRMIPVQKTQLKHIIGIIVAILCLYTAVMLANHFFPLKT